jgi:hypothetical protein
VPSWLDFCNQICEIAAFEYNYLDYCVRSGFNYEVAICLACLVSMLKVMMIQWKNNVVIGYGDVGENHRLVTVRSFFFFLHGFCVNISYNL